MEKPKQQNPLNLSDIFKLNIQEHNEVSEILEKDLKVENE